MRAQFFALPLAACRTEVETEGRERFCRRQNSDGHLMASRPRCDRPCRPAAIFFAAGTRVRQDQAELRVNIRLMFHVMVTRLHSPRTLSSPRSRNWRNPRTDLMMPNTGSGICLRRE